jgi:hypothetical protein
VKASLAIALAEEPKAVPCSGCGAIIQAAAEDGGRTLLELLCAHCGRSDVYHVNSLSPLAGSLQRSARKRAAR